MFALFAPLKIVGITFNRKTLKSAVASWFSLKPETRKSFDFIADSTCTNESGFDFFVREFLSLGPKSRATAGTSFGSR